MICEVCGIEIPRGQRYKSERYKTTPFCCEQHYLFFLNKRNKINEPFNALKDYIDNLFINPNWETIVKQIKQVKEKHNISDIDLRMTIKYAMEYEHHSFVEEYGLWQFEDYIQPMKEFRESIIQAQKIGAEFDFTEEIVAVNRSAKRKFHTNIDFD